MELSLVEFAECMNMDPGIVERWIRQGRIPAKRRGGTCIFNREILEKWAASHNLTFTAPGTKKTALIEETPAGLYTAMEKGGVHYDVPGTTVGEVLRAAVNGMNGLATQRARDLLYEKLVGREQMMSTGIGNGIAVPHPRTPVQDGEIEPQIATCLLENPVDFYAVDKKPVQILFILVAASAKQHLHLLSRISFCLRDDSFLNLLQVRPDRDALLNAVAGFENRLDRDEP